MSGYKKFAVVGAGAIGSFIVRQLLVERAAGTGSKSTVDPAAKLIPVDYLNKESVKKALTGVDIPSEFGGPTKGETEGFFGGKGQNSRTAENSLWVPVSTFITVLSWVVQPKIKHLDLDVTSGKNHSFTVMGDTKSLAQRDIQGISSEDLGRNWKCTSQSRNSMRDWLLILEHIRILAKGLGNNGAPEEDR
ncbi:hypothetical protein EDB86DRAFT_2824320 [Lactarius hatsudake]|nr:hypothetical protein EDB86DRAFT_2824320 [Lactarius hatsudake]